jgi:hypothetical protein
VQRFGAARPGLDQRLVGGRVLERVAGDDGGAVGRGIARVQQVNRSEQIRAHQIRGGRGRSGNHGRRGEMEHVVRSDRADRARHQRRFLEGRDDAPDTVLDVGEAAEIRRRPAKRMHVESSVEEATHEVRSDEPGRAGHHRHARGRRSGRAVRAHAK